MKKCCKCKETRPLSEFYRARKRADGYGTYCKECSRQHSKQYRAKNHESILARECQYRRTVSGKYYKYRKNAKRRNKPFLLTIEQFSVYWQKPCGYCGAPIETIGLDRMDNDKGYTLENVIPCCKPCNEKKGTKSLEEWQKSLR